MSRHQRMSFEEWYGEVLEIARSWSLVPADVEAVSPSWWYDCWARGVRPYDALYSGLVDVGMMTEDGRLL